MAQLLAFRAGDELYGLEVERLRELCESPTLHHIPLAPPPLLGAVNLHGTVVPVLDLPAHLGFPGGRCDPRVVALAPGNGALALAVTAVEGIVAYDPEALQSSEEQSGRYCRAALDRDGEETIHLLDAERLLAELGTTCKPTGGNHGA